MLTFCLPQRTLTLGGRITEITNKNCWTQIVLKNDIYLLVQNINSYPLCKTTQCTLFSRTKHILHTIARGIRFYVQSGVDHKTLT